MVNIKIIDTIITDIVNSTTERSFKCGYSRSTIMERLSKIPEDEKLEQLGDLLNDWEIENYIMIMDRLEAVEGKNLSDFPQKIQDQIEQMKEIRYQYDKRIITGESSPLKEYDLSKFTEAEIMDSKNEVSPLEQKQVDYQNKKLKDIDWEKYGDGTDFYGFTAYWHINGMLLMGEKEYWQQRFEKGEVKLYEEDLPLYQKEYHQKINHLNYLMDRSGGLQEDTILYRGGKFPFNMIPGMKGKFPCFSSTSYRKETAETFQDGGEYLIKIYAPKGTRGLCGGGKLGGNFPIGDESEHEFTLGKGQEYIVLNRDDWNKTVEIILI